MALKYNSFTLCKCFTSDKIESNYCNFESKGDLTENT
jgi:hypothetical protein